MTILALHLGHNATATVAENGEILGVLSQEKIDGIKNSAVFPGEAINALLAQSGKKIEDITDVAIAGTSIFPARCYAHLQGNRTQHQERKANRTAKDFANSILRKTAPPLYRLLRQGLQRKLVDEGLAELKRNLDAHKLDRVQLHFHDHHLCHARAAYHSLVPNDGKPCLVFTADGSGDGLSATVTKIDEKGRWERLGRTGESASLGAVYSGTTRFLGMRELEHEYKVMGLAPYAKDYYLDTYRRLYDPIISLSKDGLGFQGSMNTIWFYQYLCKEAPGERFDNLAAAAQHLIEERVLAWVQKVIQKTGIRRIATGGGLFMNIKLNMQIQALSEIEDVYFLPSCGDESNAIGAAYDLMALQLGNTQPLTSLYLGLAYKDEDVEAFLKKHRVFERFNVTRPVDIDEETATRLAAGEIVARFSRRNEWGARALGNRSILGHPGRIESFYAINDQIKCRDFWMPFAPTILDRLAQNYLVGYKPEKSPAPHMITAFKASNMGKDHLRAALHQGDHTLRPQVLTKNANPSYYRLIESFEKQTGIGGVLNTSMNVHGKPLVATLEQALWTLENSGLQNLALGPFMISKKEDAFPEAI